MITYNWNCKTVDVYPTQGDLEQVVYNVHFRVTGTSDELNDQGDPYSFTQIGTQVLSTEGIENFIPFSELTNEQVTGWVKEAMGEKKVASIESSLESMINLAINPVSITLEIEDNNQ